MANRRTPDTMNTDVNVVKEDEIIVDNEISVEKNIPELVENVEVSKPKIRDKKNEEISEVLDQIKSGIKTRDADLITKVSKRERLIIASDEEIPVRSCTKGGLNWVSKVSGTHYRWNDLDDVIDMSFSDLTYMYKNAKHFLTTPAIIIEDERIIDLFKLVVLYKDVASVLALEDAIDNKEEMQILCVKAIQLKMRELLIDKLASLIEDEILTNVNVIDVAEKELNCPLIKKK